MTYLNKAFGKDSYGNEVSNSDTSFRNTKRYEYESAAEKAASQGLSFLTILTMLGGILLNFGLQFLMGGKIE